jgi:hypothetical protein
MTAAIGRMMPFMVLWLIGLALLLTCPQLAP